MFKANALRYVYNAPMIVDKLMSLAFVMVFWFLVLWKVQLAMATHAGDLYFLVVALDENRLFVSLAKVRRGCNVSHLRRVLAVARASAA